MARKKDSPIGVGMTAKQMKRKRPINADLLNKIEPITDNQKTLFENYKEGKNIFAYGAAGTGKTFVALYLALKDILDPCLDFMDQFEDKEPIMLHVRRGDPNLTDPRGFKWSYTQCGAQHPVQPIDYYEKALSKFDANQPVIVFSDSVEWVKEQEFFKPDRFMISEPEDKYADGSFTPYADLCLMSLCSHAIIANSSMSWWGAWLISNPDKQVIAPKMWFGPAYADKDTKDLYYPNWIVL